MSTFQAFHNYYHKFLERISIIQHSLDLDTVVLINHINVTMLTMIGLIILTLRLKVEQKTKRTQLPFTNLKLLVIFLFLTTYLCFVQYYEYFQVLQSTNQIKYSNIGYTTFFKSLLFHAGINKK